MKKRKADKSDKGLAEARARAHRTRRINLRISPLDYIQLVELRLALHLSSDSDTVRTLVRLHHSTLRNELAKLHRQPAFNERVAEITDRQLDLFDGGKL